MRTATTGLVCDFVFMAQIIRSSLRGFYDPPARFSTIYSRTIVSGVPGRCRNGWRRGVAVTSFYIRLLFTFTPVPPGGIFGVSLFDSIVTRGFSLKAFKTNDLHLKYYIQNDDRL